MSYIKDFAWKLTPFARAVFGASEKIVEDTATGNPVSFSTDVAKKLKECTVAFTPVQSGSGDPSPENVRPITGWAGVDVWHTGKNLFNSTFANGNVDANSGSVSYYQTATNRIISNFVELLPGTYSISCKEGKQSTIYFYESASASTYVYSERLSSWTDNPRSFTLTKKRCIIIVLRNSDNSNIVPADVTEFQLELGSPASSYSPYTGTTKSIVFPDEVGTVYGGSLDVVSGVLTVTHILIQDTWGDLVKAEPIQETGLQSARIDFPVNVEQCVNQDTYGTKTLCNICKKISWSNASTTPAHYYINKENRVWMAFDKDTDNDMLIQFIGQLVTPVTYQLTPQQITSLIGDNTIWSDANGDLTVKYLKKG